MESNQVENPKARNEKAYKFFESIGSPKYVCAPMVEQSELSFRMLTRKYGATLCYTPMLHSRLTVESKGYLAANFSTCPEDRPLVVQFCANDPELLLQAAMKVQDSCDAVDLNFGCPQGIARKGHYGSFLLEEPELVFALVKKLADNLKIPVFCKIRVLPDREKTFNLVRGIQNAGCSLLTVHGRTKEQNKHLVGAADWDIIRDIKALVNIPVLANGGIHVFEDIQRCLDYTKADGVMSAESLLENPALFSGQVHDLDRLAREYVELWKRYDSNNKSFLKPHLFKILYKGLDQNTDLRDRMGAAKSEEDCLSIIDELTERRKHVPLKDKFGWYERYQKKELTPMPVEEEAGKKREEPSESITEKKEGEEPTKQVKVD